MRSFLLFTFICFQILGHAQITFEQIDNPNEFNLSIIRQSPMGEYFVQASNDQERIYSSMDGINWTAVALSSTLQLSEMQFFSDGTAIAKQMVLGDFIRRNGTWETMNLTNTQGDLKATFIRNDTLFGYEDDHFAYSLDKGQNFTTLFEYSGNLSDHIAHLWKFEQHLLFHTAGAAHRIFVFTEQGDILLDEVLQVSDPHFLYSDCGELLVLDQEHYYWIKNGGVDFEQGNTTDLFPGFESNSVAFSQGEYHYYKDTETIYRSPSCGFNWEVLATNDLINERENLWVSPQEDLVLYDRLGDHYLELANGSNEWEEKIINIQFPYLSQLNESTLGQQFVTTYNNLFSKNPSDVKWTELNQAGNNEFYFEYAPNGDLYINTGDSILYSQDNGNHFNTIDYPESTFQTEDYAMRILEDGFLFLYSSLDNGGFYSFDNGEIWILVDGLPTLGSTDPPQIMLLGNSILMADFHHAFNAVKINLNTNEISIHHVGDFPSSNSEKSTLLDDGTAYFQINDFTGQANSGLYRYQFGETPVHLGYFPDAAHLPLQSTSTGDIYAFNWHFYFEYDGNTFIERPYLDLPLEGSIQYFLSDNQFVYAIVENNQIYRSTEPLATNQIISGSIFHDVNADCSIDPMDEKLKLWQVKVENDDFLRVKIVDHNGNYKIPVPTGDYTISTQAINANWDLCTPSFDLSVSENISVQQHFLAFPLLDCADLSIDFSTPRLRRCFENYYTVRVQNTGPNASTATTVTLFLDPFFELSSATLPYTSIDASTIQFDIGALAVGDGISFNIFFTLSCDAELGAQHCLSGVVEDPNICQNSTSEYRECQENIGSFDPNDKRVFNADGLEVDMVDKEEYLYYHIRFQNTGTDTAFTVEIVDPLSPILDINTLEMLSASHPYSFEITDGPALNVLFENILLPDSTTNEPASNGFFKFRIKPLPEFDYGTSIPNQAAIYFDFNEPILTNEVTILIEESVSTKDIDRSIQFSLFPNPSQKTLNLQIEPDDWQGIDAYEITNQLGQRLLQQNKDMSAPILDIGHLPPGLYYLALKAAGKTLGVRKFVKL